ncbi:hypothetical protein QUA13_24420 [Microcoleus sp. S28C3]|uniref:hypothetical protein n=1 Tax=Microcoleus sp. S28C3 TaxID=3055414 RepID=UPI002FD6CDFF
MKVTQTATTIDTAPASFTCADCPFARHIDGNRYCCAVSQTASDVKRGHWEATISCYEALAQAKAEAEKAVAEIEKPIAQTDAPAPATPKPATPSTPAPATLSAEKTAPAAIGTDNEPPNRGDNGRGRVQPMPAKKLMLSIVPVARIKSDISASNFDRNELELLGELSLTLGGFAIPPVVVRDTSGYKVVSGHLQYHAAVIARQLNPRTGENIPVLLLESENQSVALAQLKMLRFAA